MYEICTLFNFKIISSFLFLGLTISSIAVVAEERTALDNDIHAAIKHLLDTTPAAKALSKTARGALIFPNVRKAGLLLEFNMVVVPWSEENRRADIT